MQAGVWRHLRARLFALPPLIRAYVRVEWSRTARPRDPLAYSDLIQRAASKLGAAPDDFPNLDQYRRSSLTRSLDRKALRGDLSANPELVASPAVAAWLGASAAASGAISLRQHALSSALAENASAMIEVWAHGRAAELDVAGLRLAAELHHLRPDRHEPSSTPWNADLCRRVIFVKPAGAELQLADMFPNEQDE